MQLAENVGSLSIHPIHRVATEGLHQVDWLAANMAALTSVAPSRPYFISGQRNGAPISVSSKTLGLSLSRNSGVACGLHWKSQALFSKPSAKLQCLSATVAFAGDESLPVFTINGKRRSSCIATVRAVAQPVEVAEGFEQMVAGTKRKYYMLGGKGGVGKTSLAASLAVKFANSGHATLVVSTDPAHSLSDSFAQDLAGGLLMAVDGPNLPLFAMEINPEQARKEFRDANTKEGEEGGGVQGFMDSVGLGGWVDQLSELKLGELLDTPPPGLDEAIAISKVVQFIQSPEYSHFTRIVFDTAPTGHTLRLLSLPDFLEASIGKILKLKQKLSSATNAIKSVFGQGSKNADKAHRFTPGFSSGRATGLHHGFAHDVEGEKLELLKERMIMVREIFRDKESTEFIIVTIPTVMAVNESSRLRQSLEKEGVPVKRLIVNQILPPSNTDCKFCAIKRKDQHRAMEILKGDTNLRDLEIIESPLFDLEIRGVPALTFMGNLVWKS